MWTNTKNSSSSKQKREAREEEIGDGSRHIISHLCHIVFVLLVLLNQALERDKWQMRSRDMMIGAMMERAGGALDFRPAPLGLSDERFTIVIVH